MSHTVEWITPIFDREPGDVLNAELDRTLVQPKGAYNYQDLNRIENNTKWCMEDMLERKIIRVPPSMAIKTNWTGTDIPTREDMHRIIKNILLLMSLSNPIVEQDFYTIYESNQFTYSLANAIEYNLQIMHDQPKLPIDYWLIKVVNGIIEETGTNQGEFAEDEVIHIKGIEYGEYAQYQHFDHWSGDTDDLQYVENVKEQETTFTVQYHETTLTANFKTILPRQLTINSGYISEGGIQTSGQSTGTYYSGDQILIIANRAANGKAFYKWQGTQEALDNLTGASEIDPSTCWLTMPDCDVTLTPQYIWANAHEVRVTNGYGGGWYNYNDYVNIYPNDRGPKWEFSSWSGDTGYLENVQSGSFRMPDINGYLSFTANYNYVYSYNTVNAISGTINGSSKAENLREGSTQNISASIPEGYGFDYWSLEGLGSIGNIYSANTTLTIGDGNAVVTAHFKPLYSVTMINQNNNGGTSSWNVTQGKTTSISTNEFTSDKTFEYWEDESGNRYTSTYREFNMPSQNKIFTAHYRNRNTWRLTLNDNGNTYIYDMLEGSSRGISPQHIPSGYRFKNWSYSGSIRSFQYTWSYNATIQIGNGNASVTVNYEQIPPPDPPKVYHTLTVTNGSGSGSYYEGQSFRAYGDRAPSTYEFSHWTNSNGDIISYSNPYRGNMGSSDIQIIANYKPIPYFTVEVIDGSGSGTFIRNSYPTIQMNPAPEGKRFSQWEVVSGSNSIEYPLAETSRIVNLTSNMVVRALYIKPDPEVLYTLTIKNKGITVSQEQYPAGQQVTIYADEPDEGWYFYQWDGDNQYLVDKSRPTALVNMPEKNVTLEMHYERNGYIPTYFVVIAGGKLLVETRTDEETGEITEIWDVRGEFPKGTIVQIKADTPLTGWKFNCWKAAVDAPKSIEAVNEIYNPNTFLTIDDYDITLTADVIEIPKYALTVNNGETSGSYMEGEDVTIYWNTQDTENEHHKFIKWSGNDIAYIRNFDILDSGADPITGERGANPQIIKMPGRRITITADYTTTYRIRVNGGKIQQTGTSIEYYPGSTILRIVANEPEQGKRFSHWEGHTQYLDNPYNPNAKLVTPNGAVEFNAIYVNESERNNIGYTLTDLYDNDIINLEDIIVIAGEIDKGFIITDANGHIYLITSVNGQQANIMRLTVKDTGPEEGGNNNG